ncbi:hypothetical protein ACQKO6_13095 [Pseudomonas monteilii]
MAGFKLNRSDGSVAIDANYSNLALRQKGSVVLNQVKNQTNPGVKSADVVVASDQSIIAYRSNYPCVLMYANRSGGTISYGFSGTQTESQMGAPLIVDWWLFDLPSYGLQYASGGKLIVRNPNNGQTVFDSRNKYLKIMDFVTSASGRRSYGKTPAVIVVNRAWSRSAQIMAGGQFVLEQIQTSMANTEGNDVVFSGQNLLWVAHPGSDWPTFGYSGGSPIYMIVDVQDY